IQLSNDAYIENNLLIEASSGGNLIEGGGSALIDTGDAYAGLNLINVANTNVVDSSYLLVTLNAFQGVNGDIVFPSLSEFFRSLRDSATSPRTVDIESNGSIENNLAIGS